MHLQATFSPISHQMIPLPGVPVSLTEFEEEADFGEVRDQCKGNFVCSVFVNLQLAWGAFILR